MTKPIFWLSTHLGFFTEMRPTEFVAEAIGIMGIGVAINGKLGLTRKGKSRSA